MGPDGTIYDLHTEGTLWRLSQGPTWVKLADSIASLASDRYGAVYALQSDGELRGLLGEVWTTLDTGVQSISLGNDGAVHSSKFDGSRWRYYYLHRIMEL